MSIDVRPDPRLLLAKAALVGEAPEGARLWRGDRILLATRWDWMLDGSHDEGLVLDLSKPKVRLDGLPARLDVVPWALRALARRHGWAAPTALARPAHHHARGCTVALLDDAGHPVVTLLEHDVAAWRSPANRDLVVHPFPVLDGLASDDVSRAVLAAALAMPDPRKPAP